MGDFFIQYDDSGRRYFRRLIYANILLYVLMVIVFVVSSVDIVILLLTACSVSIISIVNAIYFIHRNPPKEYSEDLG